MEKIEIKTIESIYGAVFADSRLDACLDACLETVSCQHIYVVADRALEGIVKVSGEGALLPSDRVSGVKYIEASEELKTMDTVMELCSWLLENGADRNALVIAVGGGITTDMTGFAASIYKRGVRFAYVPTTLLAQVDAAIGGKTGVNFEKYKNMLGIIRQPVFTCICPSLLVSLPFRDFLSGAAEMLKTFVIGGAEYYDRSVSLLRRFKSEVDSGRTLGETLKKNVGELTSLISAAARIKAGVVSRDCNENGERRKLNLGHTFAHAIETLCRRRECKVKNAGSRDVAVQSSLTHGEAVSVGMVLAARLARKVSGDGVPGSAFAVRLEKDLKDCGLPVECPFALGEMAEAMSRDKKAQDGIVHFVLPFGLGDVDIADMTVGQAISLLSSDQ